MAQKPSRATHLPRIHQLAAYLRTHGSFGLQIVGLSTWTQSEVFRAFVFTGEKFRPEPTFVVFRLWEHFWLQFFDPPFECPWLYINLTGKVNLIKAV